MLIFEKKFLCELCRTTCIFIPVLEHLNKPTLPVYVLQSLQGHLSVVQSLISLLNNSSDVVFLIALGTNSQIYGAREDMVSMPKYTNVCILLLELNCFTGFKVSQ